MSNVTFSMNAIGLFDINLDLTDGTKRMLRAQGNGILWLSNASGEWVVLWQR